MKTEFQDIWEYFSFPDKNLSEKKISQEVTLFFVIKGSICFIINDSKTHIVQSREMFVISSNCCYQIKTLEPVEMITCMFHVDFLQSEQGLVNELSFFNDSSDTNFNKLSINKTFFYYFSLLSQYLKDGLDSPVFYDLKRREFFLLLFFYYSKQELGRFLSGIISKDIQFEKFVLENYCTVKNVRELAALANYSTSGFIKKFQKYFNEPPYQWMQKQKAKQILQEMRQGKKSLQEIATEHNFSSYQHFSGFCKVQFGSPPTEILGKYTKSPKVNTELLLSEE